MILTDPIDVGIIKSSINLIQNKERGWLIAANVSKLTQSVATWLYSLNILATFEQQTGEQEQQQSSLHQRDCPWDGTLKEIKSKSREVLVDYPLLIPFPRSNTVVTDSFQVGFLQ